LISGVAVFLEAGCPSHHPNNSIKALKNIMKGKAQHTANHMNKNNE